MPFIVTLRVEGITWSISNNWRKNSIADMKRVYFTQLRTLFDLHPVGGFRFKFTTIDYIIAKYNNNSNTEIFSLSAHFGGISTFGTRIYIECNGKMLEIPTIEFQTGETGFVQSHPIRLIIWIALSLSVINQLNFKYLYISMGDQWKKCWLVTKTMTTSAKKSKVEVLHKPKRKRKKTSLSKRQKTHFEIYIQLK